VTVQSDRRGSLGSIYLHTILPHIQSFFLLQYNQTEEVALAVFQLLRTNNGTVQPMELCSEHYSGGTLYQNGSFTIYSEKYNGKTFKVFVDNEIFFLFRRLSILAVYLVNISHLRIINLR
jgi:hypothetical protein